MESAAGSVVKRGGWTDASVFGFIGANNAGEVRESQLAEKKATNPAVKKFAQQLVTEHRALALEMRSLAGRLSVTPDTADGDVHDVMDHARAQIKDLTDKEFSLLENGEAQKLDYLRQDRDPALFALLVDSSQSMAIRTDAVR